MNKEGSDNTYDSGLDISAQRDKLFASGFQKMPPLKIKKSTILSNHSEEQPPNTTRRGLLPQQSLSKRPSNLFQDELDSKNSPQTSQVSTGHRRSGSVAQLNIYIKKEEMTHSRSRKDLILETPQSTKEGSAALQDLLRPSQFFNKVSPRAGVVLPKGVSTLNPVSPKGIKELPTQKNTKVVTSKELQEMNQNIGPLKGVAFSENRSKFTVYQKRFLQLKDQSNPASVETLVTPKINHKHAESLSKLSPKPPQSKEAQMLKEALSQYLQPRTPAKLQASPGSHSVKQLSPAAVDKKAINFEYQSPRMLNSAMYCKRGISGNHSSKHAAGNQGENEAKWFRKEEAALQPDQGLVSIQKPGARKFIRPAQQEEEIKFEKPREEVANAVDNEVEYFKEFLGVNHQTFDFEKMMIDQRDSLKARKDGTMFIAVASPSSRKANLNSESHSKLGKSNEAELKEGDAMLRSMFAFYAKESGRQAPTMDSSKNGQGSTTCNSLKLMKELSSGRREEKLKLDDNGDLGLEEVLKGIDSEEGKKRKKDEVLRT